MNRLVPWDNDQVVQSVSSCLLPSNEQPDRKLLGVDHCLFGPMGYEANYSYPLIVWIHGADGDERQLNQVMPHISLRNYVGVSPRGTCRQDILECGGQTFTWKQTPDQIALAFDRVLDCIRIAKSRFNIANDRVFLAGFDCGGTMAVRLGLAYPEYFGGVATFSGALPRNHMPLRNFKNLRNLPLMVAYGRDSVDYDEHLLCDDLRLVHSAGMQRLTIHRYPCGDELVTQMLKDFDAWVMKLVTGDDMDCTTSQRSRYESQN